MNKSLKFTLPPPNFNKNNKDVCKSRPHFLTPSGMSLLRREKQPPPMYGKHGATVPARYLAQQTCDHLQKITKPPAEKQYCESCELEFHSMDDLKRHRAQHEKCPVAGCHYKGHPTVMDKHINALHASGLFEKFKKLSTPEEIAAWREERRKKYPTLANVLLKQKAQEQRQKRGERLEANKNRFGKVTDKKRAQPNTIHDNQNQDKRSKGESVTNNKNKKNRKNKRKQDMRNQDKTPVQNIEIKRDIKENQIEEDVYRLRCGINMFAGTSQLKDYVHFNDKKKSSKTNVLFSLVGMYGSDDDEDSEDENDKDKEDMQTKPKDKSGDSNGRCVVDDIESIGNLKANANIFNCADEFQVNNTKSANEDVQLFTDSQEISIIDTKTKETCHDNFSFTNKALVKTKEFESKLTEQLSSPKASESSNINDGNSSDEGPEEAPIQKTTTDQSLKTETTLNPDSKIEPPIKRSKLQEEPTIPLKQKLLAKRKYGLDYRKARLRKQNTMLEKLLEVDITHERNVLLQCVRYVCENNFFNIGQNSQEKPG